MDLVSTSPISSMGTLQSFEAYTPKIPGQGYFIFPEICLNDLWIWFAKHAHALSLAFGCGSGTGPSGVTRSSRLVSPDCGQDQIRLTESPETVERPRQRGPPAGALAPRQSSEEVVIVSRVRSKPEVSNYFAWMWLRYATIDIIRCSILCSGSQARFINDSKSSVGVDL